MPIANKPLKMMSPDELHAYKLDYYNRNKDRVQKARITASFVSDELNGRILKLSKIWQPMGVAIPPDGDLYNFLDGIYRRWNGMSKVGNEEINETKTYFTWDAIKDAVILKFGNESFECLMVQMYDEIVGRDDLALIMAYNINELNDDKNYLLLDGTKKTSKNILNK
ncbi:hypothetical protein T492DRAFT_833571 [Pavlovales sp. CCMP2436]|nr:hypothetical protein T492DRAFT_833571 [Pavlovales sp. CCMP2436]